MGHPYSTPTILAAPLVVLAAFAAWPTQAVAADDCLSAPNAPTPKGQHWYYHLDRTTHAKCWYLRPLQSAENKPAQTASAAGSRSETAISPMVRGSAHSAQASVPQNRAGHAQPQPVRAASARSVPAEHPVQSRPVKEASALPGSQDGASVAAASSSQSASEQSAASVWPDPPPAASKLQQADAIAGQTIATQASSSGDTSAAAGESLSQDVTASVKTAAANPAPVAGPAPMINAPASAAAVGTSLGALVQNALLVALAILLAGFVFAIAVMARRRARMNAPELDSRALPGAERHRRSEAAGEMPNGESGVRYTEAHEGSLVPEQVTMPRPFTVPGMARAGGAEPA